VPLAVTEKEAVWPTDTVWLVGGVVIDGAAVAPFTVSFTEALVALPALLLTTTSKVEPLSEVVVAGVV